MAAEKQVPMVGICYGHQAIAFALGGTVERSEKGWGVGLMSTRLIQRVSWMRPTNASEFNLHAMYQDQVSCMPNGVKLFLSSDFCPIRGFQIDENILGIQQHPDFYPTLSRDLIEKRAERIGPRSQIALNSLANRDDSSIALQWLADFLLHSISTNLRAE